MKVEVAVLGSPSLTVLMVSVDVTELEAVHAEPCKRSEEGDGAGLALTVSSTVSCFRFQQLVLRTLYTVCVALFRTAIERASCGVHMYPHS